MRFTHILLSAFPLEVWSATISNADGQQISENKKSVQLAKTFSLGQVQNHDFLGVDPPLELLRSIAKFRLGLTAELAAAVESNPELNPRFKSLLIDGEGNGNNISTVEAFPPPWYDIEFVIPASIGTPPQKTLLNLDTGSADLWTFSTDTIQTQVYSQTLYHPKASNTSQLLSGENWSIVYADGSGATGIVYKDVVEVGTASCDHQAVQSAVLVSFERSRDAFSSGIMGMAFKGLNTVFPTKQNSYFENIQDELAQPLFTANLQKGQPGNYNFGYIDKTEYTGKIAYTPIVKVEQYSDFWAIAVDGYSVGDGEFKPYTWKAIVDTGTTLIMVPQKVVDEYYSNVDGAQVDRSIGMATFPCSAKLPDFYFGIGSYRGKVPGHYINYANAGYGRCYGGIQTTGKNGLVVFGDMLLKAQFVVFDGGNKRVGFANKELAPPVNKVSV